MYDQIIALCRGAGFSPRIVQEAASEQAILGLVAARVGIALVAASLSRLWTDEVSYRLLVELEAAVEYALVWKREHRSPIVRAFLDVVRESMQEEAFTARVP